MPSIGARFYTQLDSAYLWGDMVEGELEKESIKILFLIFFKNFQKILKNFKILSTLFVEILSKFYVNIFFFRKLKMAACFVCCVSWARLTSVHILVMWQSTVKMGTSFSSGCFGLIYFDNLKRDTIGLSYRILLLLSTR